MWCFVQIDSFEGLESLQMRGCLGNRLQQGECYWMACTWHRVFQVFGTECQIECELAAVQAF